MYDCANIGFPLIVDAGELGGIAYALYVEHPKDPQPFQLSVSYTHLTLPTIYSV